MFVLQLLPVGPLVFILPAYFRTQMGTPLISCRKVEQQVLQSCCVVCECEFLVGPVPPIEQPSHPRGICIACTPISCNHRGLTIFIYQRRIGVNTVRSEEHTSELQSLMRISYAVFCLK